MLGLWQLASVIGGFPTTTQGRAIPAINACYRPLFYAWVTITIVITHLQHLVPLSVMARPTTSDFNRVGGLFSCLFIRVVYRRRGARPGTSISRATRSASTEELVWELGAGGCVVLCEAFCVDEGGVVLGDEGEGGQRGTCRGTSSPSGVARPSILHRTATENSIRK